MPALEVFLAELLQYLEDSVSDLYVDSVLAPYAGLELQELQYLHLCKGTTKKVDK